MASVLDVDEVIKPSPNAPPERVAEVTAAAIGSASRAAQIHESKQPSLDHLPAITTTTASTASAATSFVPSSPPQIYLNLLILEASLRSQYLTLRARRRQHVFFLALLAIWIAYFLWTLFLRPREDGQGLGGSVYWVVDMGEKVACMGGILTAVLIWATGQWERGVRWPRRWVSVTNRGLRGMNLKIILIKGSWWRRLGSSIALIFPYQSLFHNPGSEFRVVEFPSASTDEKRHSWSSSSSSNQYAYREGYKRPHGAREEDIAPGGDTIKVLLLPKHFSPEFRENWEVYRAEYWERENERRAALRKIVRAREREVAKQQGGWLWWTGYRGLRGKSSTSSFSSSTATAGSRGDGKALDLEKSAYGGARHPSKDRTRRLSTPRTHSRSSSRSSVGLTPEFEDGHRATRGHGRSRLGSTSTGVGGAGTLSAAAGGSVRHAKSASRTHELAPS